MATITKGLDVLVHVGGKVIGGQQNCSLSLEADTIDISNKENFGWSSFIAGAKSWSVSCDGQFITDNEGQKALMTAFMNDEEVKVEIKTGENHKGEAMYYGGFAAVTSIELEASFDDVCTLSLELQGAGPLCQTASELAEEEQKRNPATPNE